MSFKHDDPILSSLRDYLSDILGLYFMEKHDKMLIRKIEHAATAFEFSNPKIFVEWLLKNKLTEKQLGKLASHLTIGETYFFREKKSFDFLEQIYLPGLILKRYAASKWIRIWCAGCSTGEEAYSLAITLTHSIPDIKQWKITILATDINPVLLDKAKSGIYSKWSFRTSTPEFIQKYFTKTGENHFQIIPEIRNMVTFSSLNLASDNYPSIEGNTQSVDIIFCRNVLIYFSPEGNLQVSNRLYNSLINGGILVVSPVEMSSLIAPKFSKIYYAGYTIYYKGSQPNEAMADVRQVMIKPKITIPDPVSELKINQTTHSIRRTEPMQEHIPIPLLHTLNVYVGAESHIDDYLTKAEKSIKSGLFEEAEKLLSSVLKQSVTYNTKVPKLLAKTKANLGKLNEATTWCEIALSIDKLDAELHYLLAIVMHEQGNDAAATDAIKMALYIQPHFVLAHFLLGNLELKAGKTASGKKSFKNALSSLSYYDHNEILPESDGLSVGRFREIIQTINN